MKQLILTALLALPALPALAEPIYGRVTGVAPDDTLNVRAAPSADAEDIGDLAHDEMGIEVTGTDESGQWGRIIWNEGNGWIALAYFEPSPPELVPGTTLPAGLMCAGTEPFWSLRLSGAGAVFSSPEATVPDLSLLQSTPAAGSPGYPLWMSFSGASVDGLMVVRDLECSDGMSDRSYGWTADLALFSETGGLVHTGCCALPLEAGQH